jgi:hypothetical protein
MSALVLVLTIIALVAIGIAQDLLRRRISRDLARLIKINRERAGKIRNVNPEDGALLSWYSGALGAFTIARALVRGERRRIS